MKILDRYILSSFLKTFFSVFIILMFIFILQSIWLFVQELAGKNLDLIIILKFLIYLLPTLIPLILPLTILLTSIMVFGNFAENYEFAAMKSSGISLQRAMRGISFFILLLSITTFFFANNVIPWGEYQTINLRRNIAQLTPEMAIAEGQFNQIGDATIKVSEKYGDQGNQFKDVTLFKKDGNKNTTVIKSKTGELVSTKNANTLQLILYNGNYYHDVKVKSPKKRKKRPHAKSSFEKYTMNIDLSALNNVDLGSKSATASHRMLKISELIPTIDSLENKIAIDNAKDIEHLYNRLELYKKVRKHIPAIPFKTDSVLLKNSIATTIKTTSKKHKRKTIKEFVNDTTTAFKGDVLALFTKREQLEIFKMAFSHSTANSKLIKNRNTNYIYKLSDLNQHKMALQKKFALAVSCFLLFFVGAPLGAIIRKGGMGLPMVIAITLFLTYWFIGIFAENSAEKGAMPTALGAWLSTLVILPLGIMLTRNATSDKGVFNIDGIYTVFSTLWKKLFFFRKK